MHPQQVAESGHPLRQLDCPLSANGEHQRQSIILLPVLNARLHLEWQNTKSVTAMGLLMNG
jgi:hypothetical protein